MSSGLVFRFLRSRGSFVLNVDGDTGSNGEIVTLEEYLSVDEYNEYIPLLFERMRERIEGKAVKEFIPINPGKRFVKTALLLAVLSLFLVLPDFLNPPEPGFKEALSKSAVRLSEASEKDPGFAPLSERLNELNENLADDDNLFEEEKQNLEDLSKELTEQVRELERNSLTKLFEERGETRAEAIRRLSEGDMSLPETRELIMDLLSDPAVTGDKKNPFSSLSRITPGQRKTPQPRRAAAPRNREEGRGLLNPGKVILLKHDCRKVILISGGIRDYSELRAVRIFSLSGHLPTIRP